MSCYYDKSDHFFKNGVYFALDVFAHALNKRQIFIQTDQWICTAEHYWAKNGSIESRHASAAHDIALWASQTAQWINLPVAAQLPAIRPYTAWFSGFFCASERCDAAFFAHLTPETPDHPIINPTAIIIPASEILASMYIPQFNPASKNQFINQSTENPVQLTMHQSAEQLTHLNKSCFKWIQNTLLIDSLDKTEPLQILKTKTLNQLQSSSKQSEILLLQLKQAANLIDINDQSTVKPYVEMAWKLFFETPNDVNNKLKILEKF